MKIYLGEETKMKTYHNSFKEIDNETILSVRRTIKSGLFKTKNIEEKKRMFCLLHEWLCNHYNLPVIQIKFIDNYPYVGNYNRIDGIITLNKPSLVSYLHEFAHYLFITKGEENNEEKARGFSISLYYKAAPKLCTNVILSGKIIHQTTMEEN
jgi:hypothetical protein